MVWLQVCWVVPQTGDELIWTELSDTNLVDCSEEREVSLQTSSSQHVVHFRSCLRSLQLLTIQHLHLQLGNRLLPGKIKDLKEGHKIAINVAPGDKRFRHLSVPATITGGDQVGHSTGLKVGGGVATRVEVLAVLHHLLQSEPDRCCLCVITTLEAITETSCASHDVLQGTADLNYLGVGHHTHPREVLMQRDIQKITYQLVFPH